MTTQSSTKTPGDLDIDFGNAGQAAFPLTLVNNQSKLLPDGKILTAGTQQGSNVITLFRHLDTGALDTTFGDQGVAHITLRYELEIGPLKILVLPEGGALLGAPFGNPLNGWSFLMRMLPDGELDTTFGDLGLCVLYLGEDSTTLLAMALTDNGKVMAYVSSSSLSTLYLEYFLLRLDNGHLDTSFGENGSGRVSVGKDHMYDMVILPNGNIVLAGADEDWQQALVKQFMADGSPDGGFAENGVFTVPVNGIAEIRKVLPQADGKLVAAGGANVGFGSHTLITRLEADGSLDSTFNNGEPKIMVFQGYETYSLGAVLQPDGKVVTAGTSTGTVATSNFVLMRFQPNANLDTSFGINGQVMTEFGGVDHCQIVEIQDDGKMLASGSSELNPSGTPYILARYLG